MTKIKILQQDCDPSLSEDKSLPYTAYMVEYVQDEKTLFDIVICSKVSDIFDHYWDNYKENLINITQTSGTVNPKVWGNPPPAPSKKKK